MNFFEKFFEHFFQKCYINKLTVFLSLFCLRGVLPDEAFVSGFFVEIGAGGGEEEVAGILTDMVFKPDSRSLISEGPFISGRIERAGADEDCDCGSFWPTGPNCS